MLTESKIIKQIAILPASNAINCQWANQVKKNDEVISETFERKAYEVAALDGYTSDGITIDLNSFLSAFNAATLDEKVAALAAKATAEAALATATTAHTAALAAKDAELAEAAKAASDAALKAAQEAAASLAAQEKAAAEKAAFDKAVADAVAKLAPVEVAA